MEATLAWRTSGEMSSPSHQRFMMARAASKLLSSRILNNSIWMLSGPEALWFLALARKVFSSFMLKGVVSKSLGEIFLLGACMLGIYSMMGESIDLFVNGRPLPPFEIVRCGFGLLVDGYVFPMSILFFINSSVEIGFHVFDTEPLVS